MCPSGDRRKGVVTAAGLSQRACRALKEALLYTAFDDKISAPLRWAKAFSSGSAAVALAKRYCLLSLRHVDVFSFYGDVL